MFRHHTAEVRPRGGQADGHPAAGHRRLGRRRQEHPDRALLYDSEGDLRGQLAAVEQTSKARGEDYTNLALLTDACAPSGSRASRSTWPNDISPTPRRKFIIADTPGHIQYTGNMVTGASTADLAIVLVDARNGLTEQSRRHAFLTTLSGCRTWSWRQQDGPGRLRPGRVRADQ